MKTNIKKIARKSQKLAVLVVIFLFLVAGQVWASNQPTMNQTINAGTKSVDIVDSGGSSVGSPTVAFSSANYSFDTQDTTGTLGVTEAKIRAANPTNAQTLTVSIAGSATTAVWQGASYTYDFNDPDGYTDGADTDSVGGQMTVNASDGTLTGVGSCSTSYVSKGSSSSFAETGTVISSIDLITSTSNAANKFCRWDLTGVGLSQKIPAGQAADSYSVTLVLSIT